MAQTPVKKCVNDLSKDRHKNSCLFYVKVVNNLAIRLCDVMILCLCLLPVFLCEFNHHR